MVPDNIQDVALLGVLCGATQAALCIIVGFLRDLRHRR